MYARFLTEIKNAQAVNKERVKVPYSALSEAILAVLAAHHFVAGFEKKGKSPKRYLDIALAYKNGVGAIKGMKMLSHSGRRVFASYKALPSVKQGHGVVVVTTSRGVMDGTTAKKEKLGGQLLFTIW